MKEYLSPEIWITSLQWGGPVLSNSLGDGDPINHPTGCDWPLFDIQTPPLHE